MIKPKMIMFDYGNTLVKECKFDTLRGMEAVLKHSISKEIEPAIKVSEMYNNLYRDSFKKSVHSGLEVFNLSMQRLVFEYYNIKLNISNYDAEKIFWDAAAKSEPTEGIEDFLLYLDNEEIRTAVISNISFSGDSLKKRLNDFLPNNRFEFVMASSDYLYRKPCSLLFEIACSRSGILTDEMWYCGDKYDVDVLGARKVGSKAVFYNTTNKNLQTSIENDVIYIKNWSDLKNILLKL